VTENETPGSGDDETTPGSPPEPQTGYLPPSWGDEADDTVRQQDLAGYGWRVLGFLADAVVVGGLLSVIARIFHLGYFADYSVGLVLRAFYAGFLIAYWNGQTVGMRLVRVRCVEAESRGPVVLPQAMARAFSAELIAAASLIGVLGALGQAADLLWPAWDPQNQTLHDKIGRTIVLR